jgi:hypothetical protein
MRVETRQKLESKNFLCPETRVADPDWIRIQSGQWIRIRIRRIRIGIQPKLPDPDADGMNADPQPCQKRRPKMPSKNSISGVGRACWICTLQRWTPAGWARRCGCRASRTSCSWTRSGADTSPANKATSSSSSGSRRTRSLFYILFIFSTSVLDPDP